MTDFSVWWTSTEVLLSAQRMDVTTCYVLLLMLENSPGTVFVYLMQRWKVFFPGSVIQGHPEHVKTFVQLCSDRMHSGLKHAIWLWCCYSDGSGDIKWPQKKCHCIKMMRPNLPPGAEGRFNSVNPNDSMQERNEFLWPGCVLESSRGLLDGSFSWRKGGLLHKKVGWMKCGDVCDLEATGICWTPVV